MADTIREKILKNIKTALEGIAVANGYANTVQKVERVIQGGQNTVDVPYIQILAGDEESEQAPHPLIQKSLTIYVVIGTRQDQTVDPKWADEIVNAILGDVQKALQNDYQRGGNAIDTIEVANGPMPIMEGMTSLETFVEYRIVYRHNRTDPTSLT